MKRVLVIVGTRPEAVKVAPVLRAAEAWSDLALDVVWTGQHTDLVAAHALASQPAPPVHTAVGADLGTLRERVGSALRGPVDAVLAQGDTHSVVAAAEVAHARGIPFVHLEAGLRSGSRTDPWPEEDNRIRVARLAQLHLAPTPTAARNLEAEGVDGRQVVVVGNTVVDQAEHVLSTLPDRGAPSARLAHLVSASPRILFTHHRRESVGAGAEAIAGAVHRLAEDHPWLEVLALRHPNPALATSMRRLEALPNVTVMPALDHRELLWVLRGCRFVITDSGGLQEEAPSVGVPVLVTRRATERPEALERGWARLVGWDADAVGAAARNWLHEAERRRACPPTNPFGDGAAGPRCVQALRWFLGLTEHRPRGWSGPDPAHGSWYRGPDVFPACSVLPAE